MPQTKEPAENKVIDIYPSGKAHKAIVTWELGSYYRETEKTCNSGKPSTSGQVTKNPRTTSKELQGLLAWVKVSVHYSTIWTRLCKNNTCGRVARWKPLLTPKETQRLISHLPTMSWWSPWLLGKLRENVEHFGKFVFHYIWCKTDRIFQKMNIRQTVEHDGGWMIIWDCLVLQDLDDLL